MEIHSRNATTVKKILPVAVLAAMHNICCAKAVHVNLDGTAQVLIFPYYTTTREGDFENIPSYYRQDGFCEIRNEKTDSNK